MTMYARQRAAFAILPCLAKCKARFWMILHFLALHQTGQRTLVANMNKPKLVNLRLNGDMSAACANANAVVRARMNKHKHIYIQAKTKILTYTSAKDIIAYVNSAITYLCRSES